jgi:ankyrin repeat protein
MALVLMDISLILMSWTERSSPGAIGGHISTTRALTDAGININIQDSKGFTSLMHAIIHGHAVVIDILLNSGSDIQITDKTGSLSALSCVDIPHVDTPHMFCNPELQNFS